MKGYILDTDTWIEYFHRRSGVDQHIADTPADQIFASEVSIAELASHRDRCLGMTQIPVPSNIVRVPEWRSAKAEVI